MAKKSSQALANPDPLVKQALLYGQHSSIYTKMPDEIKTQFEGIFYILPEKTLRQMNYPLFQKIVNVFQTTLIKDELFLDVVNGIKKARENNQPIHDFVNRNDLIRLENMLEIQENLLKDTFGEEAVDKGSQAAKKITKGLREHRKIPIALKESEEPIEMKRGRKGIYEPESKA